MQATAKHPREMSNSGLPDQATLLKLLRYDGETGKLYWLPRTPDMFSAGKRMREHSCARWNTKHAGKEAFTTDDGKGYKTGTIFYRKCKAHRVIWCMVYGYWPDLVDHENQDKGDNRIKNLRDVDNATNGRNARLPSNNTSGRVGVCWIKREGKWRAQMQHSGEYIQMGLFSNFADACAAREAAEKQYGYHENHGRRS